MERCAHVFESKGRFFDRRDRMFGGEVFTVVHHSECIHCSKQERKVVLKKRVDADADAYERQLRFTGVKPECEYEAYLN